MISRADVYQYLHQVENLSTYEIARILKKKENSVRVNLWSRGLTRKAPGVEIEDRVEKWLRQHDYTVVRQRGDAPFDILFEDVKVDVKSASKNKNDGRYRFQLQCAKGRKKLKDLSKYVDLFLLVFLTEPNKPMFLVEPEEIRAKQTLNLNNVPFEREEYVFLGLLEGDIK